MELWITKRELAGIVNKHHKSEVFIRWAKVTFPVKKTDGHGKGCGGQILQFNISAQPDILSEYLALKTNKKTPADQGKKQNAAHLLSISAGDKPAASSKNISSNIDIDSAETKSTTPTTKSTTIPTSTTTTSGIRSDRDGGGTDSAVTISVESDAGGADLNATPTPPTLPTMPQAKGQGTSGGNNAMLDSMIDKSWLIAQAREEFILSVDRYVSNQSTTDKNSTKLIKTALQVLKDGMPHRPPTIMGHCMPDTHTLSMPQAPYDQALPPVRSRGISSELGVKIQPPSFSAFYRWRKAYEALGVRGLLPGVLGCHGESGEVGRKTILTDQARKEILAMVFENPKRKATAVWNYIQLERPEKLGGITVTGENPSYTTIQRFVKQMRVKHRTTLDYIVSHSKSRSKWKGKHQLAIGRADEKVCWPNERWEIDTSPADIICSDGVRRKIIGLVDIRSRRAIALLFDTSNGWGIAQTLRAGFLSWGLPSEMLMDNGLDYQSNLINQICLDLSIKTPTLPDYAPERKPHVERFFRTLSEGLFAELTGYTGNCIANRPELIIKKYGPSALQVLINSYLTNIYEENYHEGIEMRPRELWHMPGWTAKKIDERQLDLLLMPSKQATVRKGTLRYNNCIYYAPDFVNYESQKLEIRIDLQDASKVYCFEPKNSPGGANLYKKDDQSIQSIQNKGQEVSTDITGPANKKQAQNTQQGSQQTLQPHEIARKTHAVYICTAVDRAVAGMTPGEIRKEQYRQKKALESIIKSQEVLNSELASANGYDYNRDKDWRMQERLKQAAEKKPATLHDVQSENIELNHFKGILDDVENIDLSGVRVDTGGGDQISAIGKSGQQTVGKVASKSASSSAGTEGRTNRPEYFQTEREHYEWCFYRLLEGEEHLVTKTDKEQMAEYEQSELYRQHREYYASVTRMYQRPAAVGR